mgnify:CR=1 FL=1
MKLTKLFALTLVLSLSMSSYSAQIKKLQKRITVENESIPKNIGKKNTVLICVLTGRESRDKYMKMHVKNIYKGEYILVLESELNSSKYSDLGKFKYLFDYDRSGTIDTPSSEYYIKDRESGKYYRSHISSSSFGKLIQVYTTQMENARLNN